MGGIVQLARALEPFDLYWLEAEGFDPDALLVGAPPDPDADLPRRGADPARAVPAVLRAARDRRGDGRDAANGLSEARRICDLAAHYDTMFSPAQLHEPALHAHQRAPVRGDAELRDPRDRHGRRALEVGPIDQKLDIVDGELIVPAGRAGREHRRGGRRAAPACRTSIARVWIDRIHKVMSRHIALEILRQTAGSANPTWSSRGRRRVGSRGSSARTTNGLPASIGPPRQRRGWRPQIVQRWPPRSSSGSSKTSPRLTLMSQASGRMASRMARPMTPRVAAVSGADITM